MRALAAALCCVGLAGDRVAGACGRHSPPAVLPQAGVSSSRISVICLRLLKSSTSLPLSGHWGGGLVMGGRFPFLGTRISEPPFLKTLPPV